MKILTFFSSKIFCGSSKNWGTDEKTLLVWTVYYYIKFFEKNKIFEDLVQFFFIMQILIQN